MSGGLIFAACCAVYVAGALLTSYATGRAGVGASGDDSDTIFIALLWPLIWFIVLIFWAARKGGRC